MRKLFAASALVVVGINGAPCLAQSTAVTAAQAEPANLELAQQVVDLAFPPDRRHALLSQMGTTLEAQMRSAQRAVVGGTSDAGEEQIIQRFLDRAHAELDRSISDGAPTLFGALARAYARMFTREELTEIRAFVSTSAGSKYLQRSGDLLTDPDVAQANSAFMTRALSSIGPLEAELRRELTEYRAHNRR